jgi:glycosyltransferase involved in cell wall biosynthesis
MTRATSVIIPCYNGEKYLPEALESVCAQTAAVREIIVIDDGSTVPVRAPENWRGPPLQIVRTPNRGLPAARNLALRHATGDFVAFLDADDFWHPRKVEEQEASLRANSAAVASYTRCLELPGFFGFGPYPPSDVSEDEFLLMLWYHSFFPPSAVLVRRDALNAVGSFREDLACGEDLEMWHRLLTRGRFLQVPEPRCYYRLHEGQMTKNVYDKLIGAKHTREVIIAQHADRLVRAGLPVDRLWDAYRNEVLLIYFRRQLPAARRLLWTFWKDHPGDLRVLFYALTSLMPSILLSSLRGQIPPDRARGPAVMDAAAWKVLFGQIPVAATAS